MANIDVNIQHDFVVTADRAATWAYLIVTPKTVGQYPKLEQLVELGDNRWRWELEKLGGKGFTHQVIYAVTYHFDEAAGSIIWEPIKGEGNGLISGSFQIEEQAEGTLITLATSGTLEVPVPALLKRMAVPFVTGEFNQQIEGFAANLQRAITNY